MAPNNSGITLRQWLPLIGLTFSAFVFNTSEFMPVGLLTDIASSFSINEATAGIMISVYAWGVMVLSLPLMVFASRFDFKPMLLGIIAIFAVGQFLSAIAPSYPILIAARLVVACAHAVFWSIAAIVATRLVDVRHAPLAMTMVVTGSSIAQIAGLPLGRAIGLAVGWRATFGVVGGIAAGILVYQLAFFPKMPAGERFTLDRLPKLLNNPVLIALYATVTLATLGNFVSYSYVEPFMQQVAGLAAELITAVLMVYGASGLVGSWLFSRVYDNHKFAFLGAALVGEALALLALRFSSALLPATICTCIVWGICATAFNISFQAELIDCTEADDSTVAMSIFSGLCNLGIGTGTAIGGQVVNSIGIANIGLVGGAIVALSAVSAFAWFFPRVRAAAKASQ